MAILNKSNISIDFLRDGLFLGSQRIDEEDVEKINVTDNVIIIAKGARGEVSTPKLKAAIKHLKSLGFKESSGKGDHRKFTNERGDSVILNPAKTDSKHIDLGSAKDLARLLGHTLASLNEALS